MSAKRFGRLKPVHAGLSDPLGSQKLYLEIGSRDHAPAKVSQEKRVASDLTTATLDTRRSVGHRTH